MKKRVIYTLIIFVFLAIVFFMISMNRGIVTEKGIPLNGYIVKLENFAKSHRFYFSRSSKVTDYSTVISDHITLKNLLPNTTYYYKIEGGNLHKIHTIKEMKELHGIIANSKNSVFVFDKNLNLLYKISIPNISDSTYFKGHIYISSGKNLYIYKETSRIKALKLNQVAKKLTIYNGKLFLSTANYIYQIKDRTLIEVKKSDFDLEDYLPYKDDFLMYKKEDGVFFKNKKVLSTETLSSMIARGNYLFAGDYKGDIYIVDMRNDSIVYHKKFNFRLFSVYLHGDRLYLGGVGKMVELNIEDFAHIKTQDEINGDFVISNIKAINNKLILSEGNRGIKITDLSGKNTIKSYDSGVFAYDITYFNGKYYVSDPYKGIQIYDSAFNKIGSIEINGFVSIVYSTGKNLIFGVDKKLLIYNTEMKEIAKIPLKEIPTGIKKKYQYLFVSEHNYGFQIIDMENPSKPIIAESISSNGSARNLDFKNGRIYLANGRDVKIYDINMVINYEEKSDIKINGNAFDCIVKNNILYIDNLDKNIELYDISDPEKPRFIGKKKTNLKIVSMDKYEDYLICSAGFEGLYIYKNKDVSLELYKKISDGAYYNKVFTHGDKIIVLKGESGFDVLNSDFKKEKNIDWVLIYSTKIF